MKTDLQNHSSYSDTESGFTLNSDEANYELKPFDQIQVRTVPQFELQQNVTVEGAVQFPVNML